jgi:hypothetical protein
MTPNYLTKVQITKHFFISLVISERNQKNISHHQICDNIQLAQITCNEDKCE